MPITIHIFHTGSVCVAPALPFGGEHCGPLKAAGILGRRRDRLWLPVSAYLIDCPQGRVLFDCGWHRDMSPRGVLDRRAQLRSLGSLPLSLTNQGLLPPGQSAEEQLAAPSPGTARRVPPAGPMTSSGTAPWCS